MSFSGKYRRSVGCGLARSGIGQDFVNLRLVENRGGIAACDGNSDDDFALCMGRKRNFGINEYHLNGDRLDRPQLAIYELNDYLKEDPVNTVNAHIHSFYQIIWFKSGRGKHFVDFKAYDVFDNVIFFVAKNQVHYFDKNIHYEGILIHFSDTFLLQKDDETDFSLKFDLFTHPHQPFCRIGTGLSDVLKEYIFQMRRELSHDDVYGQQELLRCYLKSFLIQVQRSKNQAGKQVHDRGVALNGKQAQLITQI